MDHINKGSQELSLTDSSTSEFDENTTSEILTPKKSVCDVVSFSLCSLCAIKLNYLYPEQYNESFRTETTRRIVEYFRLPEKVVNSMQEFIADDEFTFLSSIKQNYKTGPFKLIEELVLFSISTGVYDARLHFLIIEVAELLGIPRDLVEIRCEFIYDQLLKVQTAASETQKDPANEKDRERRETRNKIKKYLWIGLASIGGGAVIGVTGGLAAPIVASAFAGVLGAGTVVMSSAAAGVVGSLFGVAGAGLTASKMNKRIGDLEEFAFLSLNPEYDQTSLHITIAISGWISDEGSDQFAKPWKYLRHTKEQYCLCYESKYLLELSRAMDYLLSFVVSYATQEALKYTFLASVMAAIAWPTALISIANIIDNPWDCCLGRSAQAGKHLADVLMSRKQGKRPASLIGFSLGARVIFYCLQELSERKDSEGIIGDVVLLGAPVTASVDQWRPLGRIVSGRIINGYSSSDWLLKFLYRTSSAAIRVAGLQAIQWKDRRVKNVDLTALVGGHMDYYKKLGEILDHMNIRTVANFDDDLLVSKSSVVESVASSSDSGIGRSCSNSTNVSASLSQQSMVSHEQHQHPTDSKSLSSQTPSCSPSPGEDTSENIGRPVAAAVVAATTVPATPHPPPTTELADRRNQAAAAQQRPTRGMSLVTRNPLESADAERQIPNTSRSCLMVLASSQAASIASAAGATAHRYRASSLARKRVAADLRTAGKLSSAHGNAANGARNRSRSI